ncbi:PDC sensor domain-containing protein [Crocosphaera sp.]|uniref:PDC sensor domain-containing protein n=1 Tax=Crocosphaera sp. TaxID=2729996 RepID=UPI003F2794AA|nr:hypothetical protein [Crocosphaera sp.]
MLWIFFKQRYEERQATFVKDNAEKIIDYLMNQKINIENLSKINQFRLSGKEMQKNINNQSQSSLETYFWYQMKYNPQLYQVYYASEKGEWLGIKRKQNDQLVTQYKGPETNGEFREYSLKQGGEREDEYKVIQKTNPQERPWYKSAKKSKKIGWTKAYSFENSDKNGQNSNVGLTLYQPFNNVDSNKFEGVIGIDLNLSYLIQDLSQIRTFEAQEKIFIMDCLSQSAQSEITDLSLIIAFPDSNQPNFNDPSAVEIEEQITERNYCQTKYPESDQFTFNNNEIYLSPFQEISWLLVMTFPNQLFMKPLMQLSLLIFSGGVILSVLAAILALFLSRKLSEPITTITDAAEAIQSKDLENLDFNKLEKISKKNDEIGVLAKVFLKMISVIYKREESLRKKIEQLEELTALPGQSSWSTEQEYIEQLIKTSQSIRNGDHHN